MYKGCASYLLEGRYALYMNVSDRCDSGNGDNKCARKCSTPISGTAFKFV